MKENKQKAIPEEIRFWHSPKEQVKTVIDLERLCTHLNYWGERFAECTPTFHVFYWDSNKKKPLTQGPFTSLEDVNREIITYPYPYLVFQFAAKDYDEALKTIFDFIKGNDSHETNGKLTTVSMREGSLLFSKLGLFAKAPEKQAEYSR